MNKYINKVEACAVICNVMFSKQQHVLTDITNNFIVL